MKNTNRVTTKEQLDSFLLENFKEVHSYIDQLQENIPVPFYNSVDIRESSFKYAPVDNNLYPAGMNNLCKKDLSSFKKQIQKWRQQYHIIGIIPEANTRNLAYLDHLFKLKEVLINGEEGTKSSDDVILLLPKEELPEESFPLTLTSLSGYTLTIYELQTTQDNRLMAQKTPDEKILIDAVILNHDQSKPLNIDWPNITTPVFPSPFLGWNTRKKTTHFLFYGQIVSDFCKRFSIEESLLQAEFDICEGIDFSQSIGLEVLAEKINKLQSRLKEGTKIFIKSNQGTYGMGIHVADKGEDVLSFNRKIKNKLDIGKNKIKFSSVLIQEGIETILNYDQMPAEVCIYLSQGKSIGGFMRANKEKSTIANLNSKGMVFKKYCLSELREEDHMAKEIVYDVIARLSTTACGLEILKGA